MADKARRRAQRAKRRSERGREERVSVGVARQNASLLYERNGPKEPTDRVSASDDVVLTTLSLVRSVRRVASASTRARIERACIESVGEKRVDDDLAVVAGPESAERARARAHRGRNR